MSKVDKYVNKAIAIANDDSHGYSQYHRWGPDYDCSSLVITCVQDAGIPVKTKGASYTGDMLPAFKACGFIDVANKVNFNTGRGLQYGDILLNTGFHTEIYIGNGRTVGAKSDEKGGIAGNLYGDQTGREICTGYYYNYPWYHALRYAGGGASTASSYKPSGGAKRIKYENRHGRTQAVCNVRSAPSTKAPIVAVYPKGSRINYDQVREGDGYRWISYISYSGKRRYVAYRKTTGDTKPWIVF